MAGFRRCGQNKRECRTCRVQFGGVRGGLGHLSWRVQMTVVLRQIMMARLWCWGEGGVGSCLEHREGGGEE